MRSEVRELWATALESGRFRQGTGRLTTLFRKTDGALTARHCCLGVLCELAIEAGVELTVTDVDLDADGARRAYDHAVNFPPQAVLAWADLDEQNPLVRHRDRPVSLGIVNDELSATFAEIAKLIRDQL